MYYFLDNSSMTYNMYTKTKLPQNQPTYLEGGGGGEHTCF